MRSASVAASQNFDFSTDSADAVELIDPEDTPKNVLIRAYRPGGLVYKKKAEAKLSEYKKAYRYLCGKEAPPLSFENPE